MHNQGPGLAAFPFRTELSLGPLIDFWARASDEESAICRAMGRLVREQVQAAPGLGDPNPDAALLERHGDLVDVLMSAEFPAAAWDQTQQSYGGTPGEPSFDLTVPTRRPLP